MVSLDQSWHASHAPVPCSFPCTCRLRGNAGGRTEAVPSKRRTRSVAAMSEDGAAGSGGAHGAHGAAWGAWDFMGVRGGWGGKSLFG